MLRSAFLLVVFLVNTFVLADDAVLDRYRELLVKSPKRGATFDRVYGHYVDLGQSATLYQDCEKATQDKPNNANAWLLFGLVAERRNQREETVKAFQTAAELEPENHLPMLYLGEALLHQRRVHDAIAALEEANKRLKNGNRNDRRAVLQTLALAYTRFGNPQKSLEVWNQLADLSPNDPDTLMQVAESMEEDGQLDEALKQYRRLLTMSDDPVERVNLSLAAIDIMLRQGNTDSALQDLDALLGMLESESYLADAVRDRIDRIFDRDRLPQRQIEFYQKRIEQNPADTASLLRLVKTLQRTDKNSECEKLLLDTIKVSPSNISLRLALINLLAERKDIASAVEQYQAMDKIAPVQTDDLICWGTLALQNPAKTESERRTEAANIWTRIAEKSPNDPVALVQVADIFARNKFHSEAERYYKDALALRPNDFSYREHLAAFYHQQRRKDKVLETLQPSERNLAEAGQCLLTWGYLDEAGKILQESAKKTPQDGTVQYRYLEVLLRQDMPENLSVVGELFSQVEKHIASDEQFALFLQQEASLLRSLQKLTDALNVVRESVKTSPTMRSHWHLATLLQSAGDYSSATASVEKALTMTSTPPLPLLRFSAELYEQGGNTGKAIALYQQLAQDDPARSGDHWKQIITLQVQRGELPLALESSQNLLGRGTENADRLRFVADLFLNSGRQADAVKLLRQALTYEPGNVDVLRILSQTLAEAEQHEEAIELLWRLYDRHEHLTAKMSVIEILANEYNKLGRSGELIERLQQLAKNYDRRRESMQALARVLMIQGDFEEAQVVLETMLDLPEENRTDSEFASLGILRELVGIAERQNDLANAVRYQEMLCQKSSDAKEHHHLFYLYDKQGDTAKTKKLFFDQVLRMDSLPDRLELIDTMIRREQYDIVAQVLDFLEMHEPEHWQIIFRQILVDAYQDKPVENRIREFRSRQFEDASIIPMEPPQPSPLFVFADVAPDDVNVSLELQRQFLPVLFYPEVQRVRRSQGQMPYDIDKVRTSQDAQFLVLGFLLREAMVKDFAVPGDDPTVMRRFRNTIEELREMFPVDSDQYDVLINRLRLEVWLLQLSHSVDEDKRIFSGTLKLQIDENVCQRTIWQIVRKAGLDGVADWQPALFQILITECINELVADRFPSALDSDAQLTEKLSQILDNLCQECKILPIPAEARELLDTEVTLTTTNRKEIRLKVGEPIPPDVRKTLPAGMIAILDRNNEGRLDFSIIQSSRTQNEMLHTATDFVKRSVADHRASLAESHPLTLVQKTDRLLALWKEYIDHVASETRTTNQHAFTSRYETLLWILWSQNREDDVNALEMSLRSTAQNHPLWLAENLDDFTQPVDEDSILFPPLKDFDSLEEQLQQIKTHLADILVIGNRQQVLTSPIEKQAFCELLFRHLSGMLQTRLKRYDIFSPSERTLLELPTGQLWTYLRVPSTSQQGRLVRQFFGVDSLYTTPEQILNPDQMTHLAELDRSLQQIAEFAFQVLDELKCEPADGTLALSAPAQQNVSLARYRAELQGDRSVDRSLIYALVQNPDAVGDLLPVEELFFRILLLRRGLDIKSQFVRTQNGDELTPISTNDTEQFAQFLENKQRSSLPSDVIWGQHISATLGDLVRLDLQSADKIIEPSSDVELLQLVQKLETTQKERNLTLAEQTALALLYVRLQRYEDVAATLDSMELSSTTDLPVREWIIACLAVQYGRSPGSPLQQRGSDATDRLLNFRLSERDSMFLVPILQHFNRAEEAQRILDHLAVTVSDQRLMSELFYRMNSLGDSQKENAAKIAGRILLNPAFLQNTRRITSDVYLFQEAFKLLQRQNRLESVVPMLETRLRSLRDRTDSRILTAQLYQMLDRKEEAKTLALELSLNPTAERERRDMIVRLLVDFGMNKELESMNRLLLEQNQRP